MSEFSNRISLILELEKQGRVSDVRLVTGLEQVEYQPETKHTSTG